MRGARRWAGRACGWPAAVAVTLAAGVAAYSAAARHSPTFDESAHLTAGATYWLLGDFRLHPENGNLPQRLAGIPAVLEGWRLPPLAQPCWRASEVYAFGNQFLYHAGNDPDRMIAHARAAMLPIALALWLAIYAASRRLFGPVGGMVSLLLAACDPTLLAHAPLITSDVASALFFLLAVEGIWRVLHRPDPGGVAACALALGGLFLAKMSAPIVLPVAALLAVLRLARREPLRVPGRKRPLEGRGARAAALAVVAALLAGAVAILIWTAFGFRYGAFHAAATPEARFEAGVPNLLGRDRPLGLAVAVAEDHHLLPQAYLYGFSFAVDQARARPTFMSGEIRPAGRWSFFPYAFAIKTPETLLALLLLSLWPWLRRLRGGAGERAALCAAAYRGAPYLSLAAVYGVFALSSALNIGQRHLLPLYPPLWVLAGGGASGTPGRLRRVALGVCVAWGIGTATVAWPAYLSYFNVASGGPTHAYRKLVDSSLDWGQDLPALRDWQDRVRPEGGAFYLSYFGTASPDHYGIRARRLPGFFDLDRPRVLYRLEPGDYAVSASMLELYAAPEPRGWDASQEAAYQALRRDAERRLEPAREAVPYSGELEAFDRYRLGRLCAFLRLRPPDARIGGSILLFRLSADDLRTALLGPPPSSPRSR